MKLTKNELFFLLESIDALSENGSHQAEELAENAHSALCHNDLDIEGYERVEWIRFDPNDPKTFPPQTEEGYIIAYENGTVATGIWWGIEKIFISVPRKKGITHWRPFPNPPQVEEK